MWEHSSCRYTTILKRSSQHAQGPACRSGQPLLVGSWDIEATFEWAYSPAYNLGNLHERLYMGSEVLLFVGTQSHEPPSIARTLRHFSAGPESMGPFFGPFAPSVGRQIEPNMRCYTASGRGFSFLGGI